MPGEGGFVSCFHGKDGLDAMVDLVTAELHLLEQMELYTERRAKLDLDYADRLGKLHDKIKVDENPYLSGSLMEKAWRTFLTESENKAITIMMTARLLTQQTLPQIKLLRDGKKELLEKFKWNRSHTDREFDACADEVNRLCNVYRDTLKEAAKIKEKLDRVNVSHTKESNRTKDRFEKISRKLHMTHNEYFLSIAAVNQHQKNYNATLVPYLLQSFQDVEENYVQILKDAMFGMQLNTSWCREEFITSEAELQQSIKLMQPKDEYNSFMQTNKQIQTATIPYFFDETLLEQDKEGLSADFLAVNDLTHQQLICKRKSLDDQITSINDTLEIKKKNNEEDEKCLKDSQATEKSLQTGLMNQQMKCVYSKYEIEETSCKYQICEAQRKILEEALKRVGPNGPQPYSTLVMIPNNNSPKSPKNGRKRRTTLAKLGLRKDATSSNNSLDNSPVFATTASDNNHQKSTESVNSSNASELSYDEPYESLQTAPWFHGKVDRSTVARLLKQDGDFIVREKSDSSGVHVLSVLWKSNIKHFILKCVEGKYSLEGESFTSIFALITHHYERKSVIQSSTGIILVQPVCRVFTDHDLIPHDDVQLKNKLGGGHFGDVYKGLLLSKRISVAVKTCKENVDEQVKKQFIEEAEIMKPCAHENVIKLVGVSKEKEPYYILLELCEKGDLLGVLKREGTSFDQSRLFGLSRDIAAGMAYLEGKQIIHRDLAARNCLVTKDYRVKISDFGMSREEDQEGIYTIQNTKEIPFKWCPPEVWHYTRYSVKTDVWSYGITLWEIYSLGKQPYTGWNNKQAREEIDAGYRLPIPELAPAEMGSIMQTCWMFKDTERPLFSDILISLDRIKLS